MSQQEAKDIAKYFYRASAADFKRIPNSPIAYWVPSGVLDTFDKGRALEELAPTRKGMVTARNSLYVREWHEVSLKKNGLDKFCSRDNAKKSGKKWFSYLKGGGFRRWYGNKYGVVNWEYDGALLQTTKHPSEDRVWATNFNLDYIFSKNINWGAVTSSSFSARASFGGELFDAGGSACFPIEERYYLGILALLNSKVTSFILSALNPTLNFQAGNISNIPLIENLDSKTIHENSKRCISIVKEDWDSFETSWDFLQSPFLEINENGNRLGHIQENITNKWVDMTLEVQRLEKQNNEILIDYYGLSEILVPEVSLSDITISRNPHFRYGGVRTQEELEQMNRSDMMAELVSYSVGCICGRFSIDKPGLILASEGELLEGYLMQIPSPRFEPDEDGIIPLTSLEWFPDDATNRFSEFLEIVWGKENLLDNLNFVAESLCLYAINPKRGESASETIRRYLSTQFYKDHLRTYTKRPIYWLFSSGKHKAFECLVYLHRYNEGTLARMRTEYVIPLSAKLSTYAEKLEQDRDASASTAETKRLEKEIAALHKQQAELAEFDEKLRHYADQRISLDLDDGVKVNYGKFGDLLAEVKAVTGQDSK